MKKIGWMLGLMITISLVLAVRTNAQEVDWIKQVGGPADDYSQESVIDSEGNTYLVGYTLGMFANQTSLGNIDAFI